MESVPFQQWEASASLALTRAQQFRYIIFPQSVESASADRRLPGAAHQKYVDRVRCRYIDLMRQRAHRSESASTFIIYGIVALLYFSICFPCRN